jgi:serine/threonine protein kinase
VKDAAFQHEKLGRYEILAELGQGMMGVVYKAMDPVLGRLVALKVIRVPIPIADEERDLLEQRFLLEANMAAGLSHPNIVVVHDVGRDPGSETPFMALEYLEGRTLAQTIARGGIAHWRDAVRMTAQLADALHHAHGRGIVHRDIKPANIMVVSSGTPKLLDFGIAKASAAQLTADGQCWGTPSYMSPEQAFGTTLDGRSDLFSLGSVLYELLTGRRAFAGANIPQIMNRIAQENPELPSSIDPTLPTELDTVVMRALAKDPAQRYANGRAMVEDLEDVLHGKALRPRTGLVQPIGTSFKSDPNEVSDWSPTMALPVITHAQRHGATRAIPWGLGALLGISLGFAARELESGSLRSAETSTATMSMAPGAVAVARVTQPEPWIVTPTQLPVTLPPPMATKPMSAPLPRTERVPPQPQPLVTTSILAPNAKSAMARVAISVEHGFKSGRLKVWVDDTLVLEKTLSGIEKKSVLFFTKSKGRLAEVVDVAPGERMFRVEVDGDEDQHRGGQVPGVLRSHETRLLEVKVGNQMQLGWKS